MQTRFDHYQFHWLLKHYFAKENSVGLALSSGDLVYLKFSNTFEIGSYPQLCQTISTMFRPQPGEIYLTNDPLSGGNLSSNYYFVAALDDLPARAPQKAHSLLLCIGLSTKPTIPVNESKVGSGLRIPPTPIVMQGQLNKDILSAICSHPDAEKGLENLIKKGIEKVQRRLKNIPLQPFYSQLKSPQFIQNFFDLTHKQFIKLFYDLPAGEATESLYLKDKTELKLKIEIGDDHIGFDFNGTTAGTDINLTESATASACIGATLALTDSHLPINAGLFRSIQVLAPKNTMVNAKPPAPLFQGFLDGVAFVANLAFRVVNQIHSNANLKPPTAYSGVSQCSLDIWFKNGEHFFETLEAGSPASQYHPGQTGLNIWRRSHLEPSIELAEQKYPIRIKSFSVRPQSGGSGENAGGNGVTKVIQVLEDCELRWMLMSDRPRGIAGGKDALGAELTLQAADGNRSKLENKGSMPLKGGDTIVVHSPGGGGYGIKIR